MTFEEDKEAESDIEKLIRKLWTPCASCQNQIYIDFRFCPYCGKEKENKS